MEIHQRRQRYTPSEFGFSAGESLFFQARGGSYIITTSGSLVMTGAPRWLGERVVSFDVALDAGGAGLIEEDGWVRLTGGVRGAEVRVVEPVERGGVLRLAFLRVWRRVLGFRGFKWRQVSG